MWLIGSVLVVAVIAVIALFAWYATQSTCPTSLRRYHDGSLTLHPGGRRFVDMNAFQQWWGSSGHVRECPLPVLTGAMPEEPVLTEESLREQTYAKTPIYKIDDYEFSRVFGYERGGRMIVPRQNFNMLLQGRQFDWADLPWSAEGREVKYRGLHEGFTAAGDLRREQLARFGEERSHERHESNESHEPKEVAELVEKAYAHDKEWAPVVVQTGPNNWEVNELRPRARRATPADPESSERIVNTDDNKRVTADFRYDQKQVSDSSIDPWYSDLEQVRREGVMPWTHGRDSYVEQPAPGMERAMGPTFDHVKWY